MYCWPFFLPHKKTVCADLSFGAADFAVSQIPDEFKFFESFSLLFLVAIKNQ